MAHPQRGAGHRCIREHFHEQSGGALRCRATTAIEPGAAATRQRQRDDFLAFVRAGFSPATIPGRSDKLHDGVEQCPLHLGDQRNGNCRSVVADGNRPGRELFSAPEMKPAGFTRPQIFIEYSGLNKPIAVKAARPLCKSKRVMEYGGKRSTTPLPDGRAALGKISTFVRPIAVSPLRFATAVQDLAEVHSSRYNPATVLLNMLPGLIHG